MDLRQYQIVLVSLDPTIGSEMQKTRPCIIISPNEMNKHLQTIVVAPMTSNLKDYPTRVLIKHNKSKGCAVIDQIRTIDKKRVIKTYDFITNSEIQSIKRIIQETYVD